MYFFIYSGSFYSLVVLVNKKCVQNFLLGTHQITYLPMLNRPDSTRCKSHGDKLDMYAIVKKKLNFFVINFPANWLDTREKLADLNLTLPIWYKNLDYEYLLNKCVVGQGDPGTHISHITKYSVRAELGSNGVLLLP